MSGSALTNLTRVIALIDGLIDAQLNVVLHHQCFQRLEASWRGLHFLCQQQSSQRVQIRILSVSLRELAHDLSGALDFDNTVLFQRIYGNEFDHAGGEPYGMMVLDYEVNNQSKVDWITILQQLAKIGSSAFVPMVLSMAASFFGLDNYSEYHPDLDLERTFMQQQYSRWHKLRELEESRFLYLSMPRVVWREPYQGSQAFLRNAFYHEQISNVEDYLWGSPAYLVASIASQTFAESGWFTELNQEEINMPHINPNLCERSTLLPRLETAIGETGEARLGEQGFVPIVSHGLWDRYEIRHAYAVAKQKRFSQEEATINYQVATQLQYLLGAGRFAHYIKLIAREKLGSFIGAEDCEQHLQSWIFNYCGRTEQNAKQTKPLANAKVVVSEVRGRPGRYLAKIDLQPNYQIDKITTRLRFVSELSRG